MTRYSIRLSEEASAHCRICTRSVSLETSKTDEAGNAVHEDCYVRELRLFEVNRITGEWRI
jgi:hypothetical protein